MTTYLKPNPSAHPMVRAMLERAIELDMNTTEIARRSGVSPTTIRHWNNRSNPRLDLFIAVANTVGLDLSLHNLGDE